jgi:transcriptional enhancer factor
MERRHIGLSSYLTHLLSLDDPNGPSNRQPLADSAGNAQLHALSSTSLYHESKESQARVERNMYSLPTLPSQPAAQPIANTLEARRQSTRRRRQINHSRNPIVDSPQYRAYRDRQCREGKETDQKWPSILEMAFLDGNCCSR